MRATDFTPDGERVIKHAVAMSGADESVVRFVAAYFFMEGALSMAKIGTDHVAEEAETLRAGTA